MPEILQYTFIQFLEIYKFFTKDIIFGLIIWFSGMYLLGLFTALFFKK